MGHEVQRARKLILRVLTDVYQVPPLDCHIVLLNVPDAAEPIALADVRPRSGVT